MKKLSALSLVREPAHSLCTMSRKKRSCGASAEMRAGAADRSVDVLRRRRLSVARVRSVERGLRRNAIE